MKSNSRPFTGETLTKITISLISITAISGTICSSVYVNADDVTEVIDNVNLTVPVSCTYSGGGTYNETMAGGTTKEITANAITTSCNDYNGYAIYAIGFSNGKYTSDTTGSNTDMITSLGSSYNITTSSNNTYGSNWKMKLTSPTDATIEAGYSNYTAIPSTYTKVASYIFNTTGASITPKYQITTGSSQPAGTYTGKVKYTLVHPNTEIPLHPEITTAGQICYYPNGSNVVGTMGCQDVASSIDLLASNFSRSGYGFAGWNTAFDYSGTFYGPNETISLNTADYTGDNNGLSLYAVWVKSVGSIQNWTGCSSLASGAVTALTDQRDNDTYAVAKLADNKCWMIENMRLDNTATGNSDGSLTQGYGGQFAGLANPESPWTSNISTANSLYSTDGADDTINIGTSYASSRFPRYNNQNITSRAGTITTNYNNIYSYGNYYTWAAAIADTTQYSTENQSVTGTSICPAGWHLPIGGSSANATNSEFWQLGVAAMGAAPSNNVYYTDSETNSAGKTATLTFRSYPNNFLYSGYVDSGSVNNRGRYGNYWSSTARNSNNAFYLGLYSTNANPGANVDYKYGGRAIRCLADS